MQNKIVTLDEMIQSVEKYLWRNKESLEKDIDFIIGISRGGLIPAVWISTRLNKPLITAYINKKDDVFLDRGEWIKKKNVLIVDDVIRSGKTFNKIKEMVLNYGANKVEGFFVFEDRNNELILPWDIYD